MSPEPSQLEGLKEEVAAHVERSRTLLLDVSHQIHGRPELSFEEHFAHDLLSSVLEEAGFSVERGVYGLETAFVAHAGTAGPLVAVLCEYDALPGIGHACGHNVIAATGLGASLAAAAVAARAGGRLVVLGTPGEEGGAGKHQMVDGGCLDGVSAALMVHPGPADLRSMDALALAAYQIDYFGRPAHAAARPQQGRNALDAAVLGYMGVAALRQHIQPSERVHGIFTKAGDVETIVPEHTTAVYSIRSPTSAQLKELEQRVLSCLEAGAAAAGCRMEQTHLGSLDDIITNPVLVDLFSANMTRLGRTVEDPALVGGVVGSTDMGRVSHLVPSIHPMIAVSPTGVSIHEPAFAGHAGGTAGDRAVLDGAKALAMTIVDLWADQHHLKAAGTCFNQPN